MGYIAITLVTLLVFTLIALGIAINRFDKVTTERDAHRRNWKEAEKEVRVVKQQNSQLRKEISLYQKKLEPEVEAAVDDLEDWIEEYDEPIISSKRTR